MPEEVGLHQRYSGLRTHWKTTNCKPISLEEEMALERLLTDRAGYDCNGSDVEGKLFFKSIFPQLFELTFLFVLNRRNGGQR